MPRNRRVYLLDPKELSPETIAVTFAKTSRSPKAFDEIAAELSDESSADFHEKWVVGYGHSSVAEHAVLHIAVENISRLAVECLESNRLASYTEKSSRYQVWNADQFYIPEEFSASPENEFYISTNKELFNAYQTAIEKVNNFLNENEPRGDGETDRGYKTRIRSTSADVCRYLLPASSLANVGVSINARALEHAIRKMLSHPLLEVQTIGSQIKTHALDHVPTLVKYADQNQYLKQLSQEISFDSALKQDVDQVGDWCVCQGCDMDGEARILAAYLYRKELCSYQDALDRVQNMTEEERSNLVKNLFGSLQPHDVPSRELEYANVTFDLVLDQGAYFELKRHRMMTQSPQSFTPYLGYAAPLLIKKAGCLDIFEEKMDTAKKAYDRLAQINPHAAAYILPNAYNRRVLLQMNLRSALHLIKLRCAPNAHFAIRRPTLKMAEVICASYPNLSSLFTPCTDETWQSVTEDYFYRTF